MTDPTIPAEPVDDAELEHSEVEDLDAASTLAEREPVRVMATTPTAVLGLAGTIVALGVGSPIVALIVAVAIVAVCSLLELVRARVTPAPAPAQAVHVVLSSDSDTPAARRPAAVRDHRGREVK